MPLPIVDPTGATEYTIAGRLCAPNGTVPKTVLLALHGITYTQEYWDSRFEPGTYSFARAVTRAGYAVLAIDRLGYGKSSHPFGGAVTLDVQAEVAHHVLKNLKAGKVGGQPFAHVVLVGHSYGSAVSWLETSRYNDADAVVATGWGSSIQTEPLLRFFSALSKPAFTDERLAEQVGLDPTYLTTQPGGRNQNYLYDLSNVDPEMIRYDEGVLRDTATVGEGGTFVNRYNKFPITYNLGSSEELSLPGSNHTRNIKVPQFLLNGTNELLFCGPDTMYCNSGPALEQEQRQCFSEASCFRAAVTPQAGHDLNLQRNAQASYSTIVAWLDDAIGPNGSKKSAYLETCRR